MVLIGIFFVSGADAASIVMGSLSQNGALEPKRLPVIFWGCATGGVAAVMLLVGGENGLEGLKTITILAAVPFVFVMVGMCVALVKDLSNDPLIVRRQYAVDAVTQAVITGVPAPAIGRASCRARVCQYVYISVGSVSYKTKPH